MVTKRRIFSAIVVATAIGLVSLFVYAQILKERADSLIRITYELSNFKGSPPTRANLESKFGRKLRPLDGCAPPECNYEVRQSNRLLAMLKIVPYVELRAEFGVRNGFVELGMLDYSTDTSSGDTIVVHSQMDFNEGVMFYLHPWGDSSPLETNGLVSVSSGASSAEKQEALGLNTDCMTKLGGCSTVADLLPTIWQRNSDNTIRSRLPNHEGLIDAPDWITH